MKTRTSHRFLPRLEVLEDRCVPSAAMSRPISDFLDAQGSDDNFNFGVPGLPQELGWGTSTATFEAGNGRFARIDYTGQDAAFLGLELGTTTSGTVSERALSDGTARVTVNLHTHNAFAWATKQDAILPFDDWPVIFGYTPSQLQADTSHSLRPPLANSDLHVVLTLPAPGAALPDLVDTNLSGLPPGYALVSLCFRATAQGTTPTGQQATLVVSQTEVLNPPNLIRDFGFTAEVVSVHTNQGAPPPAAASQPAAPSEAASPSSSAKASHSSSIDAALGAASPSSPAKASDSSAIDAVFATLLDEPLA